MVANSDPRFIVGIQLGSMVSYKADGLPLMKCFPQTCNAECFSANWQAVKRLIFDSHWLLLCIESSSDFLAVVTMLGKQKNPTFGAFFLLTAAYNTTDCVAHHVFVSLLFLMREFLFLPSQKISEILPLHSGIIVVLSNK